MKYNYCTLFDSFFLSRGLALYHSLKKTSADFNLYIFPFDKKSDDVLRILKLPGVIIVSQEDFETPELLSIKKTRSRGEYCWTCTPIVTSYCITNFSLDHCTYIDADLYFFSDPKVLIEELGDNSVLITEHRYTKRYDQSATSGIYCVQFVTFRNDENGIKVLTWWRDRCLEWCYDRFEDGKFGDQKYLDDWTTRFKGVHVLKHLGGGVAPWNVQQFNVKSNKIPFEIMEKNTGNTFDLIFYHFHALRFLSNNKVDLGAYKLSDADERLYSIYLREIKAANNTLLEFSITPPVQRYQTKKFIPIALHKLIRRILGVFNVYDFEKIIEDGKNS